MRTTIKVETEIEIAYIRISVPVRYAEEDIPNNFPLRKGELWEAEVCLDTGNITGWPVGQSGDLYMKVCDCGTYQLVSPQGLVIAQRINEYVPHGVVPGEYGDYIDLKVDVNGVITNWPKNPDVSVFFCDSD